MRREQAPLQVLLLTRLVRWHREPLTSMCQTSKNWPSVAMLPVDISAEG